MRFSTLLFALIIRESQHYPRKVPFRAFVDTSEMDNATAMASVDLLRLAEFAFNNRYDHAFDVLLGVRLLPAMTTSAAMIWHLQDFICRELKLGFVVALAGTTTTTSGTYTSLLGRIKIPLIDWEMPRGQFENDNENFAFSVRPAVTELLVDYIRMKSWHRIVYMHDRNQGMWTLPALYDRFEQVDQSYRLQVESFLLADDEEYFREFLSNFHRRFAGIDGNSLNAWSTSPGINVVVDVSSHYRFKVFLRALEESVLVKAQFNYVFANFEMDDNDINAFRYSLINVTGFRLIDRMEKRFSFVFVLRINRNIYFRKLKRDYDDLFPDRRQSLDDLPMSAIFAHDALLTAGATIERALADNDDDLFKNSFSRHQLYNAGYPGMICRGENDRPFMPFEHGEKIATALTKVNIGPQDGTLTGRIQFGLKTGLRVNYTATIVEIRSGTGGQGSIKQGIGFAISQTKDVTSSPAATQSIAKPSSTVDYVEHSSRPKLLIVTVEVKPFVMRKRSAGGNGETRSIADQLEGYSNNITGFDYDIFISAGNKYGARQDDGSWDGMIGYLLNETADVAVAPLTINKERERVVDFSKPFMTTGISIMIQKPEKQEFEVFSFMQPLGMRIWIFILCSYVAVSMTIYFVSSFSPYERHSNKKRDQFDVSNELSMYNSLWFTLAAFMQQGTDILPRALSGRIASSAWWFFTLIMVSSYTANLAAFLTLEKMTPPIESVDDLASQRKILYGIVKGGSTEAFFQAQMRGQLSNNVTDTIMVNTYAEGIEKVRRSKGGYAFLLEETANEYENTRKPCNTMKVGANLNTLGYGVATKIGSPWRNSINLAILYLQEKGELKRLENKWWYDRGQCDQGIAESGQSASLNLSKVAGIFYILSCGMVLALCTAFAEFAYRRRNRGQDNELPVPKVRGSVRRAPKIQRRSKSEPTKQSQISYI